MTDQEVSPNVREALAEAERAGWEAGKDDFFDDCPCGQCIGRRSFNAYKRTGKEPNWAYVHHWQARQEWLANATRTERRGASERSAETRRHARTALNPIFCSPHS